MAGGGGKHIRWREQSPMRVAEASLGLLLEVRAQTSREQEKLSRRWWGFVRAF